MTLLIKIDTDKETDFWNNIGIIENIGTHTKVIDIDILKE